ncbi:MAG: hypothetical protein CR217_01280 [Beijerinckiaceae bacterium]|nr:MAG: hypothetical protein CR217_01280 [Beijerinckiaceae bacterium]
MVCRPLQSYLKPRGFAEVPKPYHVPFKTTKCGKHEKLAKSIAKKSGRGTRRPRATIFSYNQSRTERKFNFLAGRNATPRPFKTWR